MYLPDLPIARPCGSEIPCGVGRRPDQTESGAVTWPVVPQDACSERSVESRRKNGPQTGPHTTHKPLLDPDGKSPPGHRAYRGWELRLDFRYPPGGSGEQ